MQLTAPSTIPPTPSTQPPSTQDILNVYVECGGVMPLILEKLNKQHNTTCPNKDTCKEHEIVTEASLTNIISSQLSKLQDMVRAKTIMDTYYATQLAISAAISKMTYLDPFEASKTATNFIQKLSELTDRRTHETNINLNELVYNNMTPEQQQAWVYLQGQGQSHLNESDTTNLYIQESRSMPRVIEHAELPIPTK